MTMRVTFEIETPADLENLRRFFCSARWTGEERKEEEALPLFPPSSLPPYPYPITPYNPPLPEEEKREEETTNSRARVLKNFGKFVRMTEDEHRELVAKFGENKAQQMIQNMDFYLAEDPKRQKKYKSRNHYMTLVNWERKDAKEQQRNVKPKEKTFHDIAVERGLESPDPAQDFVESFWRS